MIRRLQNIDNWTVFYLLVSVTLFSLGFSAFSHWMNGDIAWWAWLDGATQNFSTEMMGAIMTFALFELVVGTRNEKKNLLIQMRSSDNATALNALERIRENGWDKDGSLKKVNLRYANLQAANLRNANLQQVKLIDANLQSARLENASLQGAILKGANLQNTNFGLVKLQQANLSYTTLQKANLEFANLQKANLESANLQESNLFKANLQQADLWSANLCDAELTDTKFNEETLLPDGSNWTAETDMSRYTDPKHPDFWEPEWVKKQREKDGE